MIGQTISHYKILEKLGEGGMGVVYKAEDIKLRRPVALKVLPRQALITEEDKTRFAREAQVAASLSHPNVAMIHEFDEVDDPVTGGKLAFIAMEYVEGETLKQKLRERPLPIKDVVDIAIAVSEGLSKAHEKGIIHRDIKSDNVMISKDGVVKVMDFGLAEVAGRTRVTKEGMTVGTTAYMSPEQALGEKLDQRTDIWSLGVVIYEMITGRLPFAGDYEQEILYRILNEEPEPITSLRSNVPMELERIVKKVMQKDRENRYQHVDEMLTDLKSLKKELEASLIRERPTKAKFWLRRSTYLYAGVGVLTVLVFISLYFFLPLKPVSVERKSIAVLPFVNLSSDKEDEYFCDGMTEQLITNLTHLPNVKVIARTSVMQFKNSDKTIQQIAKELDVAHILEGSVRKSGNKIRVTAQLIKADDGFHLWAKDYDRQLKDIFAVQDDVSNAIVEALKVNLTPSEKAAVTKRYTESPEAYEVYLQGRFHLNKRSTEGFQRAIYHFTQATRIDSSFARAYSGLADSYSLLGFFGFGNISATESIEKARSAAKKAIQLDPMLAEAHTSLAFVKMRYDWEWDSAEEEFRRALELNPQYETAHHWYALMLISMARHEEALAAIRKALQLDPVSPIIRTVAGLVFHYMRQYDKAIDEWRQVLELDPNFGIAHLNLGRAYEQKKMYAEAIRNIQNAATISRNHAFYVGALGHAYAAAGQREKALAILEQLMSQSARGYISYHIAEIHLALGDKDAALAWLEKAYEERSGWLVYLKVEPKLDPLRTDPRFKVLLKKIGLEK